MYNDGKPRYTGPKPWMDYEWLYHQYVELDRSTQEIADEFGCKQNTIQCWLLKHGIKKEIKTRKRKEVHQYQNKEYLYNEHIVKKRPISEIARENNVSEDTIRYQLEKHGIDHWRMRTPAQFSEKDINDIIYLYTVKRLSAYEISLRYNSTHNTIINIIKNSGNRVRGHREAILVSDNINKVADSRLYDREWLYDMYHNVGLTTKDIASMLKIDKSTVSRQLKKFGIITNKGRNRKRVRSGNYVRLNDMLYRLSVFSIKPIILKRDNFTCQCCGATDVPLKAHHIHHLRDIIDEIIEEYPDCDINTDEGFETLYNLIITDIRFIDPDNQITLCTKCHKAIHNPNKKISKTISNQVLNWKFLQYNSRKGSTTIER